MKDWKFPTFPICMILQRKKWKPSRQLAAGAIDLAGADKTISNLSPAGWKFHIPYKKYAVQGNALCFRYSFYRAPHVRARYYLQSPDEPWRGNRPHCAKRFSLFAKSVSNLEDGVYLSVGSAVMSPMIFEKSLSMSQNIEIQHGGHIDNHYMLIVDLAESDWDWDKDGEPPMDNPAYYLRYCKTFNRMGGEMQYLTADNRDFLLALYQKLER